MDELDVTSEEEEEEAEAEGETEGEDEMTDVWLKTCPSCSQSFPTPATKLSSHWSLEE